MHLVPGESLTSTYPQDSGPGVAGSWQGGVESPGQPGQLLQGTSDPAGLQSGRVPALAGCRQAR